MKTLLMNSAASALLFAVMDSVWFAIFMKQFAIDKLQPILRMENGKLAAHMPSVFFAYLLMVVIAVVFLVPKVVGSTAIPVAFAYGFIMGICVFGIFDFTNAALLRPYPFSFLVADVLWGGFMYGCLGVLLSKIN